MINMEFHWEAEPMSWAGFSILDLTNIVMMMTDEFGIPSDLHGKIFLHIGDNYSSQESSVRIPTFAAMKPEIFESGKVYVAKINRSLELVKYYEKKDNWQIADFIGYSIRNKAINIKLETPQEVVLWLIGEELHHCGYYARNENNRWFPYQFFGFAAINSLYLLTRPNLKNYSLNLIEYEASKTMIGFLGNHPELTMSNRTEFYKVIENMSIKKRMTILPRLEHLVAQTFIPTGYTPPS